MTSTTAWIRPLTEATTGIPMRRDVHGSHCRTSQGLFTAWAAGLGFPDYFGHNWDAFRDCLHDAVSNADFDTPDQESPPQLAIIVHEAGNLLADEPQNALTILLNLLSEAAGDDSAAPRLLLLLDDTTDRLSQLAQRLADAGYPPASPLGKHH
jgi:hypothetical protein